MRARRIYGFLLALVLAMPLFGARDAAMQRGFKADGVYDTASVDTVDLFSGNLTAAVPIGKEYVSAGSLKYQFRLVYNSNIWDFAAHSVGIGTPSGAQANWIDQYRMFMTWNEEQGPSGESPTQDGVEAIPARSFNAGVGWLVTLGELRTSTVFNGVPQVVYIGSDGAEHSFFSNLHGAAYDVQAAGTDFYSRDGSYLRLRTPAANALQREVHFPDGTLQRFSCVQDCTKVWAQWVLNEIADPYGNLLTVTRSPSDVRPPVSTSGANWTWTYKEYFGTTEGYKTANDIGSLTKVREHTFSYRVTRADTWVSEVRLESAEIAASGGRSAKYKFNYHTADIFRDPQSSWWELASNKDPLMYPPSAAAADRISVSLLESVQLPPKENEENAQTPSGAWKFRYWGDECTDATMTTCDAASYFSTREWDGLHTFKVNVVYGRLKELELPTGNGWRYEYEQRGYPHEQLCDSPGGPNPGRFTRLVGVARRQPMKRSAGTWVADGKPWLYFGRAYTLVLGECTPREFVATVMQPPNMTVGRYDADVAKGEDPKTQVDVTFFSLSVGNDDPPWSVREHGLPVSHKESKTINNVTRGLSSQVYECSTESFFALNGVTDYVRRIVGHNLKAGETLSCGSPKRTRWVNYEDSNSPECSPTDLGRCAQSNRRESSSATEYHDDSNAYVTTDRSEFDGLGHYRREVTDGNLLQKSMPQSGRSDKRISYTKFNADVTYPNGFVPPFNWILGNSTETFVTQDGISNVKKTLYDDATGFLKAVRTLEDNTAVTAPGTADTNGVDLLTSASRTVSNGRVVITRYFYGGDSPTQQLPDDAFGEPGGGKWEYAIETTYRFGTIEKIAYKHKCGTDADTVVEQNTVDDASGLILTSKDEFGATTTYQYDLLGRYSHITPPGASAVAFDYTYPNLTRGESTIGMSRTGGESASWEFDGYGRVITDRKVQPARTSRVVTTYTMTGLEASVSTRIADDTHEPADKYTFDYHYDIFGRPVKILPPGDHSSEEKATFSYLGDRYTRRTQDGLAVNAYKASGDVSVDEYRDAHGRLVAVNEDSTGANLRTRYDYDVADRLVNVIAPSGGNTDRQFVYDGRGLLTDEKPSELAGKWIQWRLFDARGNARKRLLSSTTNAAFDTAFAFDDSERLVSVTDAGGRPLKSFTYVGGKIKQAERMNYVVNPSATSQEAKVGVTVVFDYDDAGRIKKRTLNAGIQSAIEYKYDTLGRLDNVVYDPLTDQCVNCPAAGPARTLKMSYSRDYLTGVAQTAPLARTFVSSVTYHPNDLIADMTRGNTLIESTFNDPGARPRPQRISVRKPNSTIDSWSTGPYEWDGGGSLKTEGTDEFYYDARGRLAGAKVGAAVNTPLLQTFGYDVSGNLTSMVTSGAGTAIDTDAATNRLKATRASYDDAGNVIKLTDPRRANFELLLSETPAGGTTRSWFDPFNMPTRVEAYSTAGQRTLLYGRVFLYDAFDERVAVQDYDAPGTDGTPSVRELWTVRGAGNEGMREFERVRGRATEWAWLKDYVYAGSHLVAAALAPAGNETIHHYHTDHLGTIRYVTDGAGNWVDTRGYFPFGEEINARPDNNRRKFTGHERDDDGTPSAIGDLDYMHARFYVPAMGRFMSMDPLRGAARLPLSWNRYSYVLGNPTSLIDPTGKSGISHEVPDSLGLIKFYIWWYTDSPPAKVEKTVFAGAGALVGDLSTGVVRIFSKDVNLEFAAQNEAQETAGQFGSFEEQTFAYVLPLTYNVLEWIWDDGSAFASAQMPVARFRDEITVNTKPELLKPLPIVIPVQPVDPKEIQQTPKKKQ